MSEEKQRPIEGSEIEALATKLDDFASTLEPSEQALLRALVETAGGIEESEVEGFGFGDFRGASLKAMGPLRLGAMNLANDPMTWQQWTQTRDVPILK